MSIENNPEPIASPYPDRLDEDARLHLPQSVHPQPIDPDNPPWGAAAGILTWVGSVLLLFAMGLLFVIPYIFTHTRLGDEENIKQVLATDKTFIFLQIISVIPAHLLTLFIVWAVVTRFGKRPFWEALGWSWSKNLGFWKTSGLAIVLLVVGSLITKFLGGEKQTDIDQIVSNSLQSRYALAFVAGITAPFIEELVYRGVLYSSLRKAIGMIWAVAIVTVLFAGVHVLEYRNNVGVILAVSLLSLSLTLIRAYSGKLLPCFIIHLIFNGLQAIYIAIQPYIPQSAPQIEQKAPALAMLWRAFRPLFF